MRLSVRLRLTLMMAVLAGVLALGAAVIGPGMVEDALIDEIVESEVAALDGYFGDEFGIDPTDIFGPGSEFSFDEFPFDESPVDEFPVEDFPADELPFDELPFDEFPVDEFPGPLDADFLDELFATDRDEVSFVVQSLMSSGMIDDLLDVSGTDDLIVRGGFGELFRVSADGAIEMLPVSITEVDQPVVALFDVAEVAFGLNELTLPDGSAVSLGSSPTKTIFRRVDFNGTDVIVTASVGGIEGTVTRVRTALWAALPIFVLFAALVTWLLAGRALKPVRAISQRTAMISGGTLDERVPVPKTGDEIATLATTMNSMLDRLETDDRKRRRFVSDASHELRSPVAVLKSEAEVALRAPNKTDVDSLASGVLEESTRMAAIIDDLLAIARHDEGLAAPTTAIDLDDIVLSEVARSRRVPVDATAVSAGRVMGRPDEFSRAVSHLLDNGARHAESRVTIALTTAHGRVRLVVEDDGPGVAPADRQTIFERFTRLDEARTRDRGGAGLGLSVVAGVVQRSGGSVIVEDSTHGGARFVIDLPAAP